MSLPCTQLRLLLLMLVKRNMVRLRAHYHRSHHSPAGAQQLRVQRYIMWWRYSWSCMLMGRPLRRERAMPRK